MDFEFDKEIDAILRKARGDEIAASSPNAHLDADEISAFAENALPDAARQRYTAHLADCARCRKILSNAFVYNAEAVAETASSAVSVESVETSAPWYRRLFAFPQAAYAMGAMVLLFSGFFGYLILQNLPGSSNDVSYSTNTATNPASAPAKERTSAMSNSNTASSANTTTTNSTTTANAPFQYEGTNSAANTARLSTSNTATAATPPPPQSSIAQPENNPAAEVQPMATPALKPQSKDDEADNNLAKAAPVTPIQRDDPNASGTVVPRKNERSRDESYSADGSSDNKTADDKSKNARSMQNIPKKKSASGAGEQRSVGGKTFNNVGGIWFDSAVGKQKQKSVRRGTSEYQNLDAGLRSIADSLGGTVVILWGGKAYRIQ